MGWVLLQGEMCMIHNVILAVCIGAALTVLFAALWTMIGNKVDPPGGVFSGHGLAHPLGDHLWARRRHSPPDVVVKTASERSLPGGWSLIQRTTRARRDIRLAAR
jgi:hypothetical protein